MNRRSFLGSILAAAVAPAIVRADSLMRIVPRDTLVLGGFDATQMMWATMGTARVSIEQSVEMISTSTIGQACAEIMTGLRRYAAELELELVPGIGRPRALRLDGRDVPLPEGATVTHHPCGMRVLHIPHLDLTEYGNRVPQIEVEGSPIFIRNNEDKL